MAGIDGEFDQGEEKSITITGSDLVRNVEYDVDVETSEGDSAALGFGTSCGISTAVDNLESATGRDDAIFNLRGCMAIAGVTINANLQLDGVLVATASATAHVRPSIPSDVRANGRGSISGEVYVRLVPVDRAQAYETSFSTDNINWSMPHRHNPGASDFLTFGTVRAVQLTVGQLPVNQAVQVRVRSVRADGINTVKSEWADWVGVWVSQTEPPLTHYYLAFPAGHYQYKICDSSFPNNTAAWRSDINSGFETWEDNLIWRHLDAMGNTVNIIRVSEETSGVGNCTDGREFDGNIVKGIAVQTTFRTNCFGPQTMVDPWTPEELASESCARPDATEQVRSIFFWTGYGSWDPGIPAPNRSCSVVERIAAHESGHALGLRAHLDAPGHLMSGVVTVCEQTTADLMYIIRRYQ